MCIYICVCVFNCTLQTAAVVCSEKGDLMGLIERENLTDNLIFSLKEW